MINRLLADVKLAAVTLRQYEALHRAKGTAESLAKAIVNGALAERFEKTIEVVEPFKPEQLVGLRALRLYHYQAMTRLNGFAVDLDASAAKHYRKRARYHLGHVQFLNDFFEIGDTAEQDAAK